MSAPHTVAAFDFDGTLSSRDCVVPFLCHVTGTGRLIGGLAAHPHVVVPAVVRRDRDALKAVAAGVAFGGRAVEEVVAAGREFAATVTARWLRDDTMTRLRKYQADWAAVVIVSASFEVYLTVIGEQLGVDAVLGTRLAVDGDRYTGQLDGPNCRAGEKVRRLEAWLGEQGVDRGDVTVHAYGDSAGDAALAAYADRAWSAAGSTLSAWSTR